MKSLYLILAISAAVFTSCSEDSTSTDPMPVEEALTEQEKADLQFLREEEKLARDVYTYAYQLYGAPIFNNISFSEQTHTDSVLYVMTLYGLSDKSNEEIGSFNHVELQTLYTELIARVDVSLSEAYAVGAFIEDLDIYDLGLKATHTTNADLQNLYSNLKCGSENHMRSFTNQLALIGITYIPEYIDQEQYESLLSDSQGGCGN